MVASEAEIRKVREHPIVGLVVPHLDRVAARRVGLPDRQVVATLERRLHQSRDVGDRSDRLVIPLTSSAASVRVLGRRVSATATAAASDGIGLKRRTVRNPDAAAALLRLLPERQTGPANEDDALAVGRPQRARVEVDARRHVLHGPCRDVVHHDEAVIGPCADKRDLAAVGRPLRRALNAPLNDERLLAALHLARRACWRDTRSVDLPFFDEKDRRAIRRELRVDRVEDHAPGWTAPGAGRPDGAFGSVGICRGIGDPPVAVGHRAPDEDDRRSIVRDADAGEIRSIVGCEVGQTDRRKGRRCSRIRVSLALFERGPRHAIDRLGRHELER